MMSPQRLWLALRAPENRLWVTQLVASVLAVLLALAASWAGVFFGEDAFPEIERDTLDGLLTVIASSMLAVTTFSLSIMVGAFSAATSGVTPRARPLVMADDGTRTAIAAFLSAFIYAVVAKVALGVGYYGANGRFILFLGTLAVLAWLLVTLVRWVRTLSSLGSMGNTLQKLEDASHEALLAYWQDPWLGAAGGPADDPGDAEGVPLRATAMGYVRLLDMAALQACAEAFDCRLHMRVRPGALVWPGAVLARRVALPAAAGEARQASDDEDRSDEALAQRVREAVVLGAARSFEQDPRFGLIVLSESGQRALSPAVNDPGTAIDVMNRVVGALLESERQAEEAAGDDPDAKTIRYDRRMLPPLDEAALVFDAFRPLARDGAGMVEVGIRMQKLLAVLASATRKPVLAEAARRMAEQAWAHASEALVHEHERRAVRAQLHRPAM